MDTYYIHDNGRKPFKVLVYKNGKVSVYKLVSRDEDGRATYEEKSIFEFNPTEIFIGKSFHDDEHESEIDGNTILLRLGEELYVYIGPSIFIFRSLANIIEFISNIKGYDVPYAYAIDVDGNSYLFTERIILWVKDGDPYDYYYRVNNITTDHGIVPPRKPVHKNFKGITKFLINDNRFTLTYNINPDANYDRITTFDWGDGHNGKNKLFVTKKGKKVQLRKKDYINIIEDYGSLIGVKKMDIIVMLYDRF